MDRPATVLTSTSAAASCRSWSFVELEVHERPAAALLELWQSGGRGKQLGKGGGVSAW